MSVKFPRPSFLNQLSPSASAGIVFEIFSACAKEKKEP